MTESKHNVESDNLDRSQLKDFLAGEAAHTEAEVIHHYPQTHVWKQRANQLICQSCEIDHGVVLPMGAYLVGVNADGSPRIEQQY